MSIVQGNLLILGGEGVGGGVELNSGGWNRGAPLLQRCPHFRVLK